MILTPLIYTPCQLGALPVGIRVSICENTWQHLHCLELTGFCTSATKLSKLLNSHRSILRKLLLQHIPLSRGYWREVFTKLHVRDVKVYHVSRGVDLESFLENMEELPFDQIPSSPWLHDFLLRGTSWDMTTLDSRRLEFWKRDYIREYEAICERFRVGEPAVEEGVSETRSP